MKKQLFPLFFLLGLCLNIFAGPVDIATARLAGLNFYCQQINRIKPYPFDSVICIQSFTESYQGTPVYYVFNLKNEGFVIVSADNSVTPVLGYSFTGVYSHENQPQQFIAWMEGYAKQISWSNRNHYIAGTEIGDLWKRLTSEGPRDYSPLFPNTDVAPLLISTWDQGFPYNMLCPLDAGGSGGRVWAGCVATAMSQIMYYYRWPQTGVGQHCYVPSGYSQQCADFAATTYKWNEMMNALSTAWNDTAGATLLWHAGISVNMMYGPGGSGAYSQDARTALVNTFKYTPNSILIEKSNYSEAQWSQKLRDNLDQKRPMYYDGYGTGGHAFNVDGYQGTDYFHFNWGWSGSSNGYYYLNNLNPGGYNFTQGQGAIINLYPDTVNYIYPPANNGQTVLTALSGTFEDGSGPVKNYQNNCNLSWLIDPQSISDSIVSITITFNKFNTENGVDIVSIYKGGSTSDSLIGTYSGTTLPPAVIVNNNKVLVTFQSNGSVTSEGWFVTYTTKSADWCIGSQTFTDQTRAISDGSGTFNYRNRSLCKWIIIPSTPGPLTFFFTKFKTEAGFDQVRCYDPDLDQLLASYSGDYDESNLPVPVTSSSGKMVIIFMTNATNTDEGWEGYYSVVQTGIENTSADQKIRVFPTPARDEISVQFDAGIRFPVHFELLNNTGQQIRSVTFGNDNSNGIIKMNLSGLAQGIYYLRIVTTEETITKKVLIN
ncbi:MAG: C10 family peptidase [Bacteroidales bacterium]|nr:C10 family peptidase [Bacteroidales bacterium]MDD4603470.1 C10 family peptidase [Bacteroidales bacterium]